ncbi:O-methyltransferase [Paenibacillus sp. 1001270B_150601_E10]|uniref:O-methyltransferase n=1 Tax=Paenibacillus sp. 1001270B_150601_E10 TaxID=2787079 RepID=UPI00189D4C21|nr:O-methyltransferase [Paenibacillus sp. 1001270B_150601_E10]
MTNRIEEQYLDGLYAPDKELERIQQRIKACGMPDISVEVGYGRLLTMLGRMSKAQRALEIGALGGYSGLCILRGLTGERKLMSLELKEDYAKLAKQNLEEAGFGNHVEYRIGAALDSLAILVEEQQQYDLFFIDADKENYVHYLEYCLKLAHKGAIIVVDNLFLRGRTLDPNKQGPSVQAIRKFNALLAQDKRLETTMLPAYDGLAIAIVR